jgi:DNA-binding response OmpR family regulator
MDPIVSRTDPAGANGILWVEGHPDNREFLVVLLGLAGYAVTTCDSISNASQVVRDRQFDVYIVGDCLPHGSNLPLAAEIKAINPGAPVILYSVLAFANDIESGLRAGVQAYITKPGNLDYLLATISSLLNGGPTPTDSGHRQPRQTKSARSSRKGPAGEGLPDVKLLDGNFRRRRSCIIAKPPMRPRSARSGALGPG